jgi:hypothetical protein
MNLAVSDPYDGVCHLHGILRERVIAVLGLTVYADESGTHDKRGLQLGSEVTVVAGYIATKSDWDVFTRRWRTALKKFKVGVFHMSELSAWQKHAPYNTWSETKRKRFLKTLIKIARDNTHYAIGGMVSTKDYNTILPDEVKAGIGSFVLNAPYHFCFQMLFVKFYDLLVGEVDSHYRKFGKDGEKVAFVFEQQEEYEPIAHSSFAAIKKRVDIDNRFASLTFAASECYEPLQAADLLAFYARRILTHKMQGRPWRDEFERMMEERHNLMLYYFTPKQLTEFALQATKINKAFPA